MASIAKKKAIELILKEVEKGKTYTDTFDLIRRTATLGETAFKTYWNEANQIHDKRQEAIQKKKDEALLTHELARQEHELETKDGQVRELIRHAIAINEEIQSGKAKCFNWFKGKYREQEITLTHKELHDKRQLLASLLSDIRDIRGLNAAKQQETKHSFDLEFNKWMEEGLVDVKDEARSIQKFESLK